METKLHLGPLSGIRGQNFMTREVVERRIGEHAGRAVHVEVSCGTGLSGGLIYGVTIRTPDGADVNGAPSKLFGSLKQAQRYATNLELDSDEEGS